MGVEKLAKKMADYNQRLEQGKASKIKPTHVVHVLQKLRKRELALKEAISCNKSAERRSQLEIKLAVAKEQIERAKWLLKEIQ